MSSLRTQINEAHLTIREAQQILGRALRMVEAVNTPNAIYRLGRAVDLLDRVRKEIELAELALPKEGGAPSA